MTDFGRISINTNLQQGRLTAPSFVSGLTELAWTTSSEDAIVAGTVVRIAPGPGALIVGRCDATDATKAFGFGVAGTRIPLANSGEGVQQGVTGTIVRLGVIALERDDWAQVTEDGQPLVDAAQYFLSSSTPGKITNVRPSGGAWVLPIGACKDGGVEQGAGYQRMFVAIGTPVQSLG